MSNTMAAPNTNYVSMNTEFVQYDNSIKVDYENDGIIRDREEDGEGCRHDDSSSVTASSVLTEDGIIDFSGFLCVCLVILVGDMSRGIFFPSMWPLVESLGGSQITTGYSVASFSLGRVIMNPVFGTWSHRIGYSKTLLISCTILLVGTLAYTQIQNVGRLEFLIFAQTLLGLGSATLGVTRAFVADVTPRRHRTEYMAIITAVQYGGFTVTPALGALFSILLGNRNYHFGILRLNMYTAPAYFMSCVVLSTLSILLCFFQGRHRIHETHQVQKKTSRRVAIEEVANQMTCLRISVYDCCMLGCMLLNVATKGSIASFETLGIAIAQEYFDMMASKAGAIIALCGAIGVLCLLHMGRLAQYFNDVQIIIGGMLLMTVGIASLSNIESSQNASLFGSYFVAMFMIYAVGYPVGHTAVIGLFSKIVGRRPQGTLLGWFASAGSLARIIFPVMSGYIITYASVRMLVIVLTGVLITAILFVFRSMRTLSLLST